MGLAIDRDTFTEDEYDRFSERLEQCLVALSLLLERPGFGIGPLTVGAEIELFLVDRAGGPLPYNTVVRDEAASSLLTLELGRFNLEFNATPRQLAGRPFTALGDEVRATLRMVEAAARRHDGHVALVGILPTLRAEDVQRNAITNSARYRALDFGVRRLRQEPFRIAINGQDTLELVADDVALEAANTSLQVHLRVDPGRFADTFNAAQLTTAPVLAAGVNSPLLLGRRLWDETRIALFQQAVDDRPEAAPRRAARCAFGRGWARHGVLELFADSVALFEPLLPLVDEVDPVAVARDGGIPELAELRLHQGTVWQWNRPIYDATAGGHLRVELRALPSGPTVVDMLANAAFHLGLVLAFRGEAAGWTRVVPFAVAHRNFYAAAQHGLAAGLCWPDGRGGLEALPAAELVGRLLRPAHEALVAAGVDAEESEELLAVVQARVAAAQTGATWQRRALDLLTPAMGREPALHELLDRYLEHATGGDPVHTWPLPDPPPVRA